MRQTIVGLFKSVVVLGYFLILIPMIWEDREQAKADIKKLVDWWLK